MSNLFLSGGPTRSESLWGPEAPGVHDPTQTGPQAGCKPARCVAWGFYAHCTTCLADPGVPCRKAGKQRVTPRRPHTGRALVPLPTTSPVQPLDGPWVLRIAAPCKFLSDNDMARNDWRTNSWMVAKWRKASSVEAARGGLPRGVSRVEIAACFQFTSDKGRDIDNWKATTKPVVDGLCPEKRRIIKRGKRAGKVDIGHGYGLIPDDSPAHKPQGTRITFGRQLPRAYGEGLLTVTITPLDLTIVGPTETEAVDLGAYS